MTDAYGISDLTIFWMFISLIAPTAYKPQLSMSEASRHFSRLATMKLSEWIFCSLSKWEKILNACKELVCKEMNQKAKGCAVFWLYHILFVMNFRRYLRETLKMANAEDLNRLTSCSLVLLGHIFLSLGNNAVSDTKICTHFKMRNNNCGYAIWEQL